MNTVTSIWRQLTFNQRLLSGALIGAFVLAIAIFMRWANQPDFTVLYGNVSPSDAGEIVDYLSSRGIPHRVDQGGRTILVPSQYVYEARLDLAVEGLPDAGQDGYELFDQSNFGVTDFVQRLNFKRSMEGEIARSIQSLHEVTTARVHIVIPEESLFVEDQKKTTASVILRLKGALGAPQISGIVRLVAASVEGLRPDDVTVVDTYGNLLSGAEGDDVAAVASSQMKLTSTVEKHLRAKVVSMLENVLGPGKVVAEVNADLDFEVINRTVETFDPENPAVRSEQRIKGTEGDGKNENLVTNYELSRTLEQINSPVGGVRKLTVAVLVDGSTRAGDDGVMAYVPRTEEEMQRFRGIIQTAVGFDETRGDRIEVHNVSFDNSAALAEKDALSHSGRMTLVIQLLQRVGQVLVVLLLAMLVRGFYRQTNAAVRSQMSSVSERRQAAIDVAAPPPVSTEEQEYRNMQQQVIQLVDQRPTEISAVLRAWLKEE